MKPMNISSAIMAFSQGEKIKSSVICITQSIELLGGLFGAEREGAEKVVKMNVEMTAMEIHLSQKITGDESWVDILKHVDMALVMIDSGVPQEASFHLTRALSHVTGIGQRSMTFLKEKDLL